MAKRDEFSNKWIIENAIPIIASYDKGILTLRGLHYRLVSIGMTNSQRHYKRVVKALSDARWNGQVEFEAFSDHERGLVTQTKCEPTDLDDEIGSAKSSIEFWAENYYLNRWENQPYYPEVFIEKKALQGVFNVPCEDKGVALGPCKGYPSLTFLKDASKRFQAAIDRGQTPIILYFGDYDPSGEDIPRSINDNLGLMSTPIEVRRIALMKHQVVKWGLPHAPVKQSDSRTSKWGGLGQVELDAVDPDKLQDLCSDAIDAIFDDDLYSELLTRQAEEKVIYKTELRRFLIDEFTEEDE